MKEPKAILFFTLLFFAFQLISILLTPQIKVYEGDLTTPFWIILWVLIGTAIFILLVRKRKIMFTKSWIIISYFIATFFAFSVFFDIIPALLLAIAIMALREVLRSRWMHNLGELIAYFGIVQMFVPMFSPITVVILLAILAIYDLISVFVTKHMLKLVKSSAETGYIPAVIFSRTPRMLGGGDFIFPTIYSATMWAYGLHTLAIYSAIAATLGLLSLLLIGKKKKAYPALPPITIGVYIATLIYFIISFF